MTNLSWSFWARLLGAAGLLLSALYLATDWFPDWFGYIVGTVGFAGWAAAIQARQDRK